MKKIPALIITSIVLLLSSFVKKESTVAGAWYVKQGDIENVFVYKDGYFTNTFFSEVTKQFISSTGGTCIEKKGKLVCNIEFDTKEKENIGKQQAWSFVLTGDKLTIEINGVKRELSRIDHGVAPLAGNWRISGRMQNGTMNTIQKADRKTLKLLSGKRFQWIAINAVTKEFFGTGGGTYTFENGKYTEHISFFSRDSTRVGASLTFDGSVANDVWTHKGLNSKGEPLHEEWSREK